MTKPRKSEKQSNNNKSHNPHNKPHSWAAVVSLFTCKYLQVQPHQHDVQQQAKKKGVGSTQRRSKKATKCSVLLCSNSTKAVVQKPDPAAVPSPPLSSSSSASSPEENKKRASFSLTSSSSNSRSMKTNYNSRSSSSSSSSSSLFAAATAMASSSPSKAGHSRTRNMPFRRLSGCYECRMVVDPLLAMTRDPSLRSSVRVCAECGEIFMKAENLELHQTVKHAVTELGPEDTSRNIVEIIFQSSWLKRQTSACKIDRILKVQNTPRTISKFEEYRDTIRSKAKKHPRCLADGNELLRFHCTTLMCSLGLNGSSGLCGSVPSCGVCSVIKNGFRLTPESASAKGILTTAASGWAHDSARLALDDGRRAMLVCRVIAGRVKKDPFEGDLDGYDSVGGSSYSGLDELYVFNPKAILPCFVVVYRGFGN